MTHSSNKRHDLSTNKILNCHVCLEKQINIKAYIKFYLCVPEPKTHFLLQKKNSFFM